MSDFVKMLKAEMARLMLEGKTLDLGDGSIAYLDKDSHTTPFRQKMGKGAPIPLIDGWNLPCRVKEAPTWEPKFRELCLGRAGNKNPWLPIEFGFNDREGGYYAVGGVWHQQIAPFSESLKGTTDPIPGQLGGE